MSNHIWNWVWNPFSSKAREQREEARRLLKLASDLHERSVSMKTKHSLIYQEQKAISDELKDQRRKNHFADMFQSIPHRDDN